MTFSTFLDRLGFPPAKRRSANLQHSDGRQQRYRRNRRRAILETLEDRRVLATYMVTSLADTGAGTLRNALQLANATGDTDTIAFDNALSGTINLGAANGALPVTSPVSIQGPGASTLTVDANATVADKFRVFEISDAANDVSISGLTLTGGLVDDAGGAILFRSAETLTIVDSVISGNQASSGGGIYSEYEGTVSVNSSTISGNTAESSHGGGIHNVDGDVSLTDSIVSGNYSYSDGAGIFSQYAGNITVTDSQVVNNKVTEAGYHGGGIYGANGDVTITGSTISGNESKGDGGGVYSYKGTVSIANTTITGNTADYSGGGVFNYDGDLTITSSLISSNTADYGTGGGVGNASGGVTISGSRITGNHAVADGGGVANNTGMVRVIGSLLDANSTAADGAGIASAVGAVIVTNSTITGNSATVRGGGIQADVAPVRLVHTTLVLNTAGVSGGGIGVVDDATGESILIYNSIVADNTATTGPDFFVPGDPGTVLDIQSSLISDNSDSTLVASPGDANGNVIGSAASPADAMLSALAHNGGTTNTHDINSSSPAINSANAALSFDFGPDGMFGTGDDLTLVADQRGGLYDRSIGLGTDMGSLEKQARPTLVVDTTADVVNGDYSPGDRSLREMLALANGDLGDDVISFSLSLPATLTLDPMLGSLAIVDNLSVQGPGAGQLTIQNASATAFRIFDIAGTTAEASFSGVTLQGGDAGAGDGGAIRSAASAQLQLQNVDLIDNAAANGGALAVSSGQVEIHDATITGNVASSEGGALALFGSQCEIFHSTIAGNNAAADGGAITAGSGQVAIISSTIANNTAGANGGAVAVTAATSSLTTLNSTLSGNSATTAGGGIYSENTAVTLTTSTLTLNTASSGGGIGFLADGNGEELHLFNTIVADNTAGTAPDFLAPGSLGALTFSVVYSLIGNNSGTSLTESTFSGGQPVPDADGNLIGGGTSPLVDPQLSSLADNGGPTQTHALVETSPAVDTGAHAAQLPQDEHDLDGDGNDTEFLPVDQRGDWAVRVVNVRSDIGAFELPPAAVINWSNPADIVYGTALGVTQLNASTSSGFGSFVYDPAAGTVLQAGGNQTLTTTFTPNELRQYRVTTATVEINVLKADPVLNWNDPADIVYLTALGTTQLNATVVGDLPGSFAYMPDHGTVLDAGLNQSLSVTFTPTDMANYNEATADVEIDVLKATPVLTWNDPADIPYGTLLDGTQLNATVVDDVPGTFAYTPDAGTLLDVGIDQQLDVLFTPTDDDNYNTANASVEIDVVKADPVLSWSDPSAITYGTALDGTQLNATVNGGLPGTFDYVPASGVVLGAGVDQTLSVVFSPTDTVRYNQVAANVEIDVLKADPAITWNDPAAIPQGTLLSGIQLDATADVPGTFVYDPDVGIQLGVGNNQLLSVVFTPDETANYNSASDSVTIDVLPNQAPSFVASDPATVLEDAGLQTVPGFISSFDPGTGESALQSVLTYHISNVGYPAMFTTLPSVTTAGVLTYETAANVFGEATFEVTVQDDGGVEGGGVDMSAAQTFTITIQGVNDAPSFSLGSEVQVLEDSGAQTVVGFASSFSPGQYEDGTWPGSQVMHDEGSDGTSDPLSTDNMNPTPLGATQPGSNLVSGYVEAAFSVGDMDVFTFTVETGFQWSGLYVDAYDYPNGAMGDNAAFLGINDDTFFPYNADDFANDPTVDYNAFLGGTIFGTSDLGGGSILSRAGVVTGSGFIGPLGAGTYTIYIQQTGPASRYTLDIEVTSVASQSLSSHEVSNVSIPSLFSAGPAIDANGDLTFTPAADTFGTATFQVRVLDDGGIDNGGVDASGFLTGTITIQGVNDAPGFSLGSEVEVLEDSGAQTVAGFASGFAPGQYEDGTWPGSQVMHDEGSDGTSDPLSTDNMNPTPLGATQPGSNLVSGYVEAAFSVGDMDVFTFTVETGFQWSGLYVDAYDYPNGAMGDNAAFLGINDDTFFPYNADDFANDPTVDYNAFLGGTIFGTSDLGGGSILSRAGVVTGSGFSGPLGAGTYTIYIQQTGPASRYTLDIEVTSVASQSLSSHEVSNVSIPSLFSAGPAIDANGDLTFTPADDTFGTATFQVRVLDDGGTDNGGVDASGFLTGTITVQEVVLDRDYGDAPSPYAVLSVDGGASHLVGTLMLGSSVDMEADGQPSVNADGDGADEDGVTELAGVIAVSGVATTSSFSILASESGRLDAWIDFDQNGVWTDSGEQVATNLAVGSGDNTLSYVIPDGTAPGTKVARFRLSSVGGLAPTGHANDGEVEDNVLIVSDGGVPSAVSVQLNAPTTTIAIVGGVLTVDNGSTDLFSAPVTAVDQLTVNGWTGNDAVSLAFEAGPANGMLVDGAAGDNSVLVSGSLVDFTTAGSVAASNFQTIDMTTVEVSEIRLDATSVAALSPVSKTVRVNGSQGDRLVLTDPDEWRMEMPVVDDDHFLRVAVNQATSEQVQVDIASSAWQNLVESSDVDANGMTSVFDALLIITEVGRNSFSDAITLALDDPLSVGAWPGVYFDVNEDGRVTTLDALQILNSLAVIGGGEGETSGSHSSRDLSTGRALANIPSQDRLGIAAGLQSNAHRSETAVGEFCLPTKLAQMAPVQGLTLNQAEVSARLGVEATRDNPMGPGLWSDRVDELLSDREVSDGWL